MRKCSVIIVSLFLTHALFATVVSDPIGDADPGFVYTHDIAQIEGTASADQLFLRVDFYNPITHTESGMPSALFGYVELWLDENFMPQGGFCGNGGQPGDSNWLINRGGIGIPDFSIEFFPGENRAGEFQAFLVDNNLGLPIGPQPTVWGPDYVEIWVPLALLNGDNGIMYVGSVFGDSNGPTDCAPDVDPFLTSRGSIVPTMSTAGLIIFSLAIIVLVVLRRRKIS